MEPTQDVLAEYVKQHTHAEYKKLSHSKTARENMIFQNCFLPPLSAVFIPNLAYFSFLIRIVELF